MVIIENILVMHMYSMLHTKFYNHRPFGSGEEIFNRFTMYGRGGHVGHVTKIICIISRSHKPWRLYMSFGYNRSSGFPEVSNC